MRRTSGFAALFAIGVLAFATLANAQVLPPIKAANLNKQAVSWPAGLPAARTILLVAFDRKQQTQIDGWVAGMKLKAPGSPAWFEVPLIKDPGGFIRGFIDGGMRRGIPSTADRARVVTLYGDKKKLMASMGLTSDAVVHVLIVERSGRIVERVSGAYSAAGATRILSALK
jgi:hypothetical protein